MNKTIYALVLIFFCSLISYAQIRNFEKHADSLFKTWDNENQPGGAATVIKDGKIIYLKGFGSANIETNLSISTQTKFQLGELSKQFTTLAILLLLEEGKISSNDDIRKYLIEFPKYEHIITINHLLNHSSGLYDINRVNYMVNGCMTITTQSKALKLIASQKQLSYQPGTYFSFHESITESVLMAEIVARSSGQSFADFVKTNIFEPLEMRHSVVRDNSNAILNNVAQPYQKGDGEDYKKLEVISSVVGAINVYSSAEDLAKWYLNYTNPQGKIGRLIQRLDTPVQLDNGKTFVYYWGKMAIGREFAHPERGLPIFWNYGLQGGYGTNVFRYIDQNIISFALGNSNQYNGALAQGVLSPLVENLYTEPAMINFKAKKIKKLSTKKLKTFEGHYWFKEGYASELFVENDTLRTKWLFSPKNRYQTLVPLADDTFQQYAKMEANRIFRFKKEGKDTTLFFTFNKSRADIMERYEPVNLSLKELQPYAGTYYNKEYGSLFSFSIKDGKLIANNFNHNDITLRPVKKDVFTSTSMFFNALKFLRHKSGEIIGFSMVTDGIHNLIFEKIAATNSNY